MKGLKMKRPDLYYGYGQPVICAGEEFVITGARLNENGDAVIYNLGRRAPKSSRYIFETLEEGIPHADITPIATDAPWFRTFPVIFLMIKSWKSGNPMAVSPTDAPTDYPWECNSYQHIGQHGATSYDWVTCEESRVARWAEYRDLLVELLNYGDGSDEGSGYWNITVIKHKPSEDQTLAWFFARKNEIKERNKYLVGVEK
jgi:hypothetical protein